MSLKFAIRVLHFDVYKETSSDNRNTKPDVKTNDHELKLPSSFYKKGNLIFYVRKLFG